MFDVCFESEADISRRQRLLSANSGRHPSHTVSLSAWASVARGRQRALAVFDY